MQNRKKNGARIIEITLLKVRELKQLKQLLLLPSHPCSSGGRQLGRDEGIGDVQGKLHQLVGITDVRQAQPEDGPLALGEAAVALFKVPEETTSQNDISKISPFGVFFPAIQR